MAPASVLVVDDSPVDRARAGGLLKLRPGLVPAYASNGREALALIHERRPDIVVTDLQMPETDGLQLVEAIRRQHPSVPVILMTAHGSEEIAVKALRKGAASYVAKRNLAAELADVVQSVLELARADRGQQKMLERLTQTESQFELDNDISNIPPLIGQLDSNLTRMHLCDETGRIRVGVALREALMNAVYHGNLELTSELLERDDKAYMDLADRRRREAPFANRRIYVTARETRTEAVYVIRDEGNGFDPALIPDPTDPGRLEKCSGRGLLLIRTFMDEMIHNAKGNEIRMVKRRDLDS
jgi:CheY-like chemotaxis protein